MGAKITSAVVLLALLVVQDGHAGWLPHKEPMQWQDMGGLVSIPGAPLPPVSRDAVVMAIKIFEPGLAVLRLFGDTDAVARGDGYLATLYAALGDDAQAEQLFDRAASIQKKNGASALDRAWLQNNRGMWHQQSGRYAAAIQWFRSAASHLPPEIMAESSEARIVTLQNLATAYWLLGDVDHAEGAFSDALDFLHRSGMENSHAGRITRANFAMLEASIGDFPVARRAFEKLLDEPGLTRNVRSHVLVNLGYALAASRQFSDAERRLLEARSLTADGSGQRMEVLLSLASTYGMAENYEQAERIAQELDPIVRKLYGQDSRYAAAVKMILGVTAISRNELVLADRRMTQAINTFSGNRGDDEIKMFATRNLALVAQLRGQPERAAALSRQALHEAKEQLARILAFGSEAQRLAYRDHAAPYDQLANLGDPYLLADAVLTMKGVVLESLLAERALARKSASGADRDQLDRIHELKVRVMEETGREGAARDSLLRELTREETALARRLATQLMKEPVGVDLASVQSCVGAREVLVEIIRYQRYIGRGKVVWAYGGVVIPQRGSPSWVPLSDAAPIDTAIGKLINSVGSGQRSAIATSVNEVENAKEEEVRTTLRSLHDALWAPLVLTFPSGTKQVLLNPDGATAFLPWGALLDEQGVFAAEKWQLTQIGSSRRFVAQPAESSSRTLMAFADSSGDLRFSRQEAEGIARTAKEHDWSATVYAGREATEQKLQHRKGPRILHFATHGGELHEYGAEGIARRFRSNPMYRGYLLLAGGDETLNRWKRGETVPAENDGLLTAEEASGLDLSETWVTVLAACDTGAGDSRAGEGVMGLRHGFALAGTRYLLFSLWPVNDSATSDFMKAFYRRLFEANDPSRAFHETQVAELRRWKETKGLTRAVSFAAGFVLTR